MAKTYNFNGLAESKMDPDAVRIIKALFAWLATQAWASAIWPGSGWRTGSTEHQSGRAVDIMITSKINQRPTSDEKTAALRLVDVLVTHGKTLGIQWVLFSRDGEVTWSYNLDRGSWKKMGDRGSVSANHVDHIHVYFKTSAKLPAGFTFGSTSTPKVPGLPGTGWDGKTFPGIDAFRDGRKHAAVKVVQERLVAHGYAPGKIDSYWGPKTAAATRRFQQAQGWTGDDADGLPGPDTWARLLAAPKPKGKSIAQMAAEIIAGKHGIGHETRRRSLGIDAATYARVRAEVNRRV
jgi:hypothetical protein